MVKPESGRGASKDVIIIAVPSRLKDLVPALEDCIHAVDVQLQASADGCAVDYGKVERDLEEKLSAVERSAHAVMLGALSSNAEQIEVGGKRYTRAVLSWGNYYTMAGPIQIERYLYRESGTRNTATIDPIAVRSGIIGRGWLPYTATAMAHLHQSGTSRAAVQTAKTMGRLPYSRASFERIPHAVDEIYLAHQDRIGEQLVYEYEIPEEARSVSVSIDRVSVAMEEPRKRPVGRPRKNAPKRPISRQWRMAYCATVTLHDAKGRALFTFRYGTMPEGDEQLLCGRISYQVLQLMEARQDLKLSLLADGAHEMWHLLETHLPIEVFETRNTLIDFWHLIEKLAPAAKLLAAKDSDDVLQRWKRSLKSKSSAASSILAELRASGSEQAWLDSKQPVHEAMTYLENHADRLDYASALKQGLPIGSGNVEATCKTLIAMRMKRCGSRWKTVTGEHVIQARALGLGDSWQRGMDLLMENRGMPVTKLAA